MNSSASTEELTWKLTRSMATVATSAWMMRRRELAKERSTLLSSKLTWAASAWRKWQGQRLAKRPWSRLGYETTMPVATRPTAYLGDLHRRADGLVVHHHRVVLHRGEWRYLAHGICRVDAGVASVMGLTMTAAQLSKTLRVDALASFA